MANIPVYPSIYFSRCSFMLICLVELVVFFFFLFLLDVPINKYAQVSVCACGFLDLFFIRYICYIRLILWYFIMAHKKTGSCEKQREKKRKTRRPIIIRHIHKIINESLRPCFFLLNLNVWREFFFLVFPFHFIYFETKTNSWNRKCCKLC